MTAPPHLAIHLGNGGVAAINAIDTLVRADPALFVQRDGNVWMRRATDGCNYRITAIWFCEYLARHCIFVEDGKRVRPPGFIFEQIRRRQVAR